MTTDELKTALINLPAGERANIAQFLIDSLDEQPESDVERAWDAELARRYEKIENGTAEGKPAEEVFKRLREKYS